MRSSSMRLVLSTSGLILATFSPLHAQSKFPPPIIPQGFGVNIHFVEPQPGQLSKLKEIGFRYARMDFKWREVETVKGQYDFSGYDRLTAALKAQGARPLYILDYGNPLYDEGMAPYTDGGRAAFARFAAAAAKHFRNQDVIWEIWNEPNLTQFWKPSANAENYAALAIRTARELRAADPSACIIGPGTSKFPWPYFETLFRNGFLKEIDAISVHPYRDTYPESSARDYLRLRQMIAANTPPGEPEIPIVCSEWGYSSYPKGVTEEVQAIYVVRQWLSNLASGVNLSIYYDLMDDGVKKEEKEHNFGTVRFQTLEPKPLFTAAKALLADLNGYRYVHRLPGKSEHDWKLLFQKDNQFAVTSWNSNPRSSLAEQTPRSRFVKTGDSEFAEFKLLAAVRYAPDALVATPYSPAELKINLVNPDNTPAQVEVKVGGKTVPLQLAANGSGQAHFTLPIASAQTVGADLGGGTQATSLPVEVSWNGQTIQHLPPIHLAPAHSLAFEMNPDNEAVEIRVKNLQGTPFKGKVRLETAHGNTEIPLEITASGIQTVRSNVDGTKPISLVAFDDNGLEVARQRKQRFLSMPGYPGTLEAAAPLQAVEHVEDVPTPKAPLLVTNAEGPAPIALAMGYGTSPGRLYTQAKPIGNEPMPANATALILWVHANKDGMKLRSRFKDATGQSFQVDLGELNWQGWKRLRIPLYDGETTTWGGAMDGIPHLPLKWEGVLLVDGSRKPEGKNQVLLAAPNYVLAE